MKEISKRRTKRVASRAINGDDSRSSSPARYARNSGANRIPGIKGVKGNAGRSRKPSVSWNGRLWRWNDRCGDYIIGFVKNGRRVLLKLREEREKAREREPDAELGASQIGAEVLAAESPISHDDYLPDFVKPNRRDNEFPSGAEGDAMRIGSSIRRRKKREPRLPTFQGLDSTVRDQALNDRWGDCDLSTLESVADELEKTERRWEAGMAAIKPQAVSKRDKKYSKWRTTLRKGREFFARLWRVLISLILRKSAEEEIEEEPLGARERARAYPAPTEPAASAEEFLNRLSDARKTSLKYGESEWRKHLAEIYARKVRTLQVLQLSEKPSREDAILNIGNLVKKTRNDIKKRSLLRALQKEERRLDDLNSKIERYKNRLSIARTFREINRASVNECLDLLFPDRGGTSFFTEEFESQVISLFAAHGREQVAREVLDLYNKIARSYNTGNAFSFILPNSVVFEDLRLEGDSKNGDWNDALRRIRLCSSIQDVNLLRKTFAHELAHWFENRVLGYAQTTANTRWLSEQTGFAIPPILPKPVRIPARRRPTLCVRIDGYSQTVYGKMLTSNGIAYQNSEVLSTAFEALISDPETFARNNPLHFNLLLNNLRLLEAIYA